MRKFLMLLPIEMMIISCSFEYIPRSTDRAKCRAISTDSVPMASVRDF